MSERPWETEPDSLDFEAEGLPCAMRRNMKWGTWCGYVGVARGHPLFGLPTNRMLKLPSNWYDGRRGLEGASSLDFFLHALTGPANIEDGCPISLALQVHGGVNYAKNRVDTEETDRWWFGFDCGHAGDYLPTGEHLDDIMREMVQSMPEEVRGIMRRITNPEKTYRDQQYVVGECQSLAAQLNAIAEVIKTESAHGSPHGRRD